MLEFPPSFDLLDRVLLFLLLAPLDWAGSGAHDRPVSKLPSSILLPVNILLLQELGSDFSIVVLSSLLLLWYLEPWDITS